LTGLRIQFPPGHQVGFRLGNLTFGGRVVQLVNGRPTVETPGGDFITADGMPEFEEFFRAHGECECAKCGRPYHRHPPSGPLFDGFNSCVGPATAGW
jgi:hypothetical protein